MEEQLIVGFDEDGSWCLAGGQFKAKDCQQYFEKLKRGEFGN